MKNAVHITRIGLTIQEGDLQRMMLIWDKFIMPRHITFDDGLRMVYQKKRTRADEENERHIVHKEEGDKDVTTGGVDSDDDDVSVMRQTTREARPKGWKEGKYQCFSVPAYSNIGDITGLASRGGIVLPDHLVEKMKTEDLRTNQLIYHDVNQDAGHGWVVYVNKKLYHKVSPEMMLALKFTENSDIARHQEKEEVKVDPLNTGNPIQTNYGELGQLQALANKFKQTGQFKKARDSTAKERVAKINKKADETKMQTARTELVDDVSAVGVGPAVESYKAEMKEIVPPQPQLSTSQSSNVFEQAQAVDQKDEALKDIALDVQLEAQAFKRGAEIEDHEAQPDGSFKKKKEDKGKGPDPEIQAAVEKVVQKVDHAASVVEDMDITKSSNKEEVGAAIGEAKAAADEEQDVRNKAYEAAISQKDADIATLNKNFAEHTEANVLLQKKLDEMGIAHEAVAQENANYEFQMKKMHQKLAKSEKQMGQMVAKPKETASDGMGIHKAFAMFGDGAHKVSQGDYTSSESMAAIMALVFLFGVAMIGMNYAKGGV